MAICRVTCTLLYLNSHHTRSMPWSFKPAEDRTDPPSSGSKATRRFLDSAVILVSTITRLDFSHFPSQVWIDVTLILQTLFKLSCLITTERKQPWQVSRNNSWPRYVLLVFSLFFWMWWLVWPSIPLPAARRSLYSLCRSMVHGRWYIHGSATWT